MVTGRLFKPKPFKVGAKYRITDPDGTIRDVENVTSRLVTDIQVAGGKVLFIPVEQQVKGAFQPEEVAPTEKVEPPPVEEVIPPGQQAQLTISDIGVDASRKAEAQLEPFRTSEGLYNVRAAREAGISDEIIVQFFGEQALVDIGPPEAQIEALRAVFPEKFLPEASFGFTEEEIPTVVAEQTVARVREDPQAFIADLVSRGRTPEVELLINTYFDVQPGDIDRLFEQLPDAEARLFREALPLLVTDRNKDAMLTYLFENPDALRRSLIAVGRNTETETLVKTLYPEITEKGLGEYFNPRVPGTVEGVDSTAIGALPTKTWLDKVKEVIDKEPAISPMTQKRVFKELGLE
ncbi:hypothetical protein LCGC14_1710130 [marine sediment metagenome]|uniref:Uncharacterized protein n=1 Tax=marine sediment metagenome TaxID=412755 RepID=A0A0F9JVZ3_9ZZZZ